ncbi:GNAT family N-acetyltransferase [Rivibacter subsaxonicus]|uniref:RimJ/RimL family protein N-acetyltransferase n=1 Tax=Rivibacter subsaxonicus TaxID=457575 RepID=A0A4Q7VGL5_9BURK|nr:GNAT family protein [Rivibacter subsaxonicus]RZT95180.1 RimJ/RimL family protein N-acetyltransferase [Rivibacter subsaxonicus]
MNAQDLIGAPRELQTPRLLLRAPRQDFAAAFVESLNRSLPGLRWIGWGQSAQTVEWGRAFMDKGLAFVERGDGLIFYVFEKADGAYVGRIDLHSWDFEAPRCEVGYVGDVRSAGRGLMREAVLACVDLAFALGAARVQALSDAGNDAALRFVEQALGFTREGVLRFYERDAQGRLGEQLMFAAYNPAAH